MKLVMTEIIFMSTDKVVLVVEDDIRFAKIMIEKAHEMDLKVVVAQILEKYLISPINTILLL